LLELISVYTNARRVLKFDPETQQLPASLVGDVLGGKGGFKWKGEALATDGFIYCIPYCSTQVVAIDPLKELAMTPHNNFRLHPQELGCLFVKKDEECETFFESSLRKFGGDDFFKLI
jgi:hypothetical protein